MKFLFRYRIEEKRVKYWTKCFYKILCMENLLLISRFATKEDFQIDRLFTENISTQTFMKNRGTTMLILDNYTILIFD